MSRAVRDVSTPGNALTDADIRQHRDLPALPPPMAPGSMDEVQGLCAMQASNPDACTVLACGHGFAALL